VRGSTVYQVQQVFQAVNEIGSSKHDAKAEARAEGAATWHQVGKELGIYSFSTADAYRDVWRACLDHAKETAGIRDIEKLSGEAVRAFLVSKVDQGVAHATFGQYAAALEKLEVALNRYADQHGTEREYAFSGNIQGARDVAVNLERFEGSRAYADPDRLVAAVEKEPYNLAAALQREGGARISEINHVTREQLQGVREDPRTGELKGWVEVEGKGGKEREIGVSPETYARLDAVVGGGQRFEFDKDAYREDLKAAAAKTGQEYEGSHGLRWSWAQERHAELQEAGMTYEQSLTQISQEMGHERGDITEHYLR
jgi:integrase